MTSNVDFIRTYFDTAWADPTASPMEAAEKFFSDDFQNIDQDDNVLMDKAAYMGMGQLMFAAFQDFKFVYSDLHPEGDGVIVNGHFEGTHTGDLDLSAMGIGVVPASGKKIVWPESSSKWKVEGGKLLSIQEISGGMADFLAPLGVTPPSA